MAEDGIIKVPYNITVQPGGKISLDLLNAARNVWYGNEFVLEAGTHKGIYKRRVPAGESTTSLVFRNYHLETAGQTTFTIEEIDLQQEESLRLNSTGLPIHFAKEPDGKITIVTDNNASASYQLETDRFAVKNGETIRVPYNITVEEGGIMALGLLNTARNGWYNELVLKAGSHEGIFEGIVPEGETVTSLVFRNYHLGTPGQTTFTIKDVKIEKEGKVSTPSY